ncbi:endothelin-converting enzyme homolog isoform X3 [Patella vulgata]|uniref:endothelin-converting enzyme homolog isoform X3 n=1 Tax=Patella vulgata TaxID=6465 RepID=UPI00217F4BF8|nr:endothelin-converting enzyme homolog isoform X3 [Patella vulgata]
MSFKRIITRFLVWWTADRPRGALFRTACSEENELLNANAIKMTEAPFGKSDSEDDIVEDYDVLAIRTPCCRNRTGLEKFLMAAMLVAFVVIIGLAVGLTRPILKEEKKHCKTKECIQAASSILENMDQTARPCSNFYQYACGGWEKKTPMPPGHHMWDRFQQLSEQNLYVLKNLIEKHELKTAAEKNVKSFYESCMMTTNQDVDPTLRKFRDLIKNVGGWSVPGSPGEETTNDTWLFNVALESIHKLGAWPLFEIKIEIDEYAPSQKHILKIDLGETNLPSDLFPVPRTGTTPISTNTTVSTTPTPVKVTVNKDIAEVKRVFLDETTHLLMFFGLTKDEAATKAQNLLKLEEAIASISPNMPHSHDPNSLYNLKTIESMETEYPIVDWIQYINSLGFRVTGYDEVVVLHPLYLTRLSHLTQDYMSTNNTKQILRDYMVLSLIRSIKPYFDPRVFDFEESEEDSMVVPWERCAFYTNQALGFATGAIYVHGTTQADNVDKIERLISYVKDAFKDYLLRKFWMDDVTKQKAAQKIDDIIEKISYPSFILNSTFLDSYYKEFVVVPDDWFKNILHWRKFQLTTNNRLLTEKPDRKHSWIRPPVTVNAFYSPIKNDIIFPIAMFHLPFYIPGGPLAMNFGAMGSVIGHEIAHAFDIQGRKHDNTGKLVDWWDPSTAEKFAITTECMKDQYSKIKIQDYTVNGNFTLDENIADNGGLRAANFAYQMWVEENGAELPLPGLNLTNYQVFFISYAQMYCSKWSNLGLLKHLLTDKHSPGLARVNGALTNSKSFSWAFDCSYESNMNSRVKCEVW